MTASRAGGVGARCVAVVVVAGLWPALAHAQTWARTYEAGDFTSAQNVMATTDGGSILCGSHPDTVASSGYPWVLKLTGGGDIAWEMLYPALAGGGLFAIAAAPAGGYAVAGMYVVGASQVQAWVLRTDAQGALLWQKGYGAGNNEIATAVVETTGGFLVAGVYFWNQSQETLFVLRLDAAGSIVWQKGYPGRHGAAAIEPTADGGAVIASFEDGAWIAKVDALGAMAWQKIYREGTAIQTFVSAVNPTGDGGYIFTGFNDRDLWVVKLDAAGAIEWQRAFGDGTSQSPGWVGLSVREAPGGGFAVAAVSPVQSGVILLKLDGTGNLEWQRAYADPKRVADVVAGMDLGVPSGFVLAGNSYLTAASRVRVVRVDDMGKIGASCAEVPAIAVRGRNTGAVAVDAVGEEVIAFAATDTAAVAQATTTLVQQQCPGPLPRPLLRASLSRIDPPFPALRDVLPLDLARHLYLSPFTSGDIDPDGFVFDDPNRPLIFYAIDGPETLSLTKTADRHVRVIF